MGWGRVVRVDLFDYELPPELIAQEAIEPRDAARLMVLDRAAGTIEHRLVRDLPELLRRDDLLVVNDTRVLPARLFGRKEGSGGQVEILLLERISRNSAHSETWRGLMRASRMPGPETPILLGHDLRAWRVRSLDEDGSAELRLETKGDLSKLLAQTGVPPLPPYIRRTREDPRTARDRERYQTLFAREDGAVAAPTAGLHFTEELLDRLERRGVHRTRVTLHVGEGTFRSLREERVEEIRLHAERYRVPGESSRAIAAARARGGRVVAVGTTVTRTLESRTMGPDGSPEAGEGKTSIFISPGHSFAFVDILLTNFHLPRSTLLMLVAAFAGREQVLAAYAQAVRERYRFYSYGDAMLVL